MRSLVILLGVLGLSGCGRAPAPLPDFGAVPPFTLTAQTGKEFCSEELAGKIWVANFIFTNCTGPCPRMSSQMRMVGAAVEDLADVRMVSFTVDPERDTPEVLAAYAKRFQAPEGRWYFLTGPQAALHALNREAFKLGNVDGQLDHSTRFVLIDRAGHIRGYYHSSEAEDIGRLTADVRRLAKERV